MECPRCGGTIETYTLDGNRAFACASCSYVGVPTDHRPDARESSETWDDALDRFQTRDVPPDDRRERPAQPVLEENATDGNPSADEPGKNADHGDDANEENEPNTEDGAAAEGDDRDDVA